MVLHHTEHISKETYSKAKYTYNIQILIYNVKQYIVNKDTESFKQYATCPKNSSIPTHPLTLFEEGKMEEEPE